MKSSRLRFFNVIVGISAISAAATFVLYLATGFFAMPVAADSFVDFYLGLLVIGVLLSLALLKRRDSAARLTVLEGEILSSVAARLEYRQKKTWNEQMEAICRVQRLPGHAEVNFHIRGTGANPYLSLPLFSNREKFSIADVKIDMPEFKVSVDARIWCKAGRLFSIEFQGDASNLGAAITANKGIGCIATATLTMRHLK
jgi:hypothetical protein